MAEYLGKYQVIIRDHDSGQSYQHTGSHVEGTVSAIILLVCPGIYIALRNLDSKPGLGRGRGFRFWTFIAEGSGGRER